MPQEIQRAFVTGATGMTGRAVVRALLDDGVEVKALVLPGADAGDIPEDSIIRGDISDVGPLARGLAGADVCFHAAAMNAIYLRGRGDIRRQYAVNVDGTRKLLKTAVTAECPRVVITGTAAILRPPQPGSAATEEHVADSSALAIHWLRSRLEAEQAALAHEGTEVVVVSPTAVLGPGGRVPTPLGALLRGFLRGEIAAFPDAPVNVLDVRDCARGHVLAATRGEPGRRYILGGENLTLAALLERLAAKADLKPPASPAPVWRAMFAAAWQELKTKLGGNAPDLPLAAVRMLLGGMHVDTGLARTELGFDARPLDETLTDAAKWYA
jgi:dihydroflavonol-4-reductase